MHTHILESCKPIFSIFVLEERGPLHCKNWGVKMTPVGVNRGPHPHVLKLHSRVSI